MEGPIGRYARASEDYTGTKSVAHVLGACVANTISASGCVSAWNKDPVFGVIGIQSGL